MMPASGLTAPLTTFISVDLPAPFSPTRAWTSPRRSSRSTPLRACVEPNRLLMPRITRASSPEACAAEAAVASKADMPESHCSLRPGSFLGVRRGFDGALGLEVGLEQLPRADRIEIGAGDYI